MKKPIQNKLPEQFKNIGTIKQRLMLKLVYFEPMLNSHEIARRISVSNVHDISRGLNVKLKKIGYVIDKDKKDGHCKPHRWKLKQIKLEGNDEN